MGFAGTVLYPNVYPNGYSNRLFLVYSSMITKNRLSVDKYGVIVFYTHK